MDYKSPLVISEDAITFSGNAEFNNIDKSYNLENGAEDIEIIGGGGRQNRPTNPTSNKVSDSDTKKLIDPKNEKASECAPVLAEAKVCSSPNAINQIAKELGLQEKIDPVAVINEAKVKTGCESESCIYTRAFGNLAGELKRFNPKGPWNNKDWLSNSDIDDVLSLYVQKYPRLLHVPFQMSDFKAQNSELSLVDWTSALRKYDNVACVLNTDKTGGKGEHWVCVFVDFKNGTVEYFDSAASEILPEFYDWAVETASHLSEISGRKFREIIVTKVEHQEENTECGVYALYYIINRLMGAPYSAFEFQKIPDENMVAFRKFLFRHS